MFSWVHSVPQYFIYFYWVGMKVISEIYRFDMKPFVPGLAHEYLWFVSSIHTPMTDRDLSINVHYMSML